MPPMTTVSARAKLRRAAKIWPQISRSSRPWLIGAGGAVSTERRLDTFLRRPMRRGRDLLPELRRHESQTDRRPLLGAAGALYRAERAPKSNIHLYKIAEDVSTSVVMSGAEITVGSIPTAARRMGSSVWALADMFHSWVAESSPRYHERACAIPPTRKIHATTTR